MAAILEHVFNASYVTMYISKFQTQVKLALVHLFTPANTDELIMEKGKVYLEKMMLHRSIGVKLARVDEKGNFVGRIYHPGGDIASEILK